MKFDWFIILLLQSDNIVRSLDTTTFAVALLAFLGTLTTVWSQIRINRLKFESDENIKRLEKEAEDRKKVAEGKADVIEKKAKQAEAKTTEFELVLKGYKDLLDQLEKRRESAEKQLERRAEVAEKRADEAAKRAEAAEQRQYDSDMRLAKLDAFLEFHKLIPPTFEK